mgnify:CR=1 FL=1
MAERLLGLPPGTSTGELVIVVLLFDPEEESNARDILTGLLASANGRYMEVLTVGRVLRVLVPLAVVTGTPPPSPLRLEPFDLGSLHAGLASHLQQLDDKLDLAHDQPTGYVIYVIWGPRAARSPARLDGYADFNGIGRPVQVEYVYLSTAPLHAHAPTPEPIDTVTVNAWQMVETQSHAAGDYGTPHSTTSNHYSLCPLALAPRASLGQPPSGGVLTAADSTATPAPTIGPTTQAPPSLGSAPHGPPSNPSVHLISLPRWVVATAVGSALGLIALMSLGLVVICARESAPPVVAPP